MNIYISPRNEEALRKWSEGEEGRTMSGLVNDLLEGFLLNGTSGITYYKDNEPARRATFDVPNKKQLPLPLDLNELEPPVVENNRTTSEVMAEIEEVEAQIREVEAFNQDPESRAAQVKELIDYKQELWNEYHELKES